MATWANLCERVIGLGDGISRAHRDADHQQRLRDLERFRMFFDHGGEILIVADVDTGCVVDANDEACRQLETKRSGLVDQRLSEIDARLSLERLASVPVEMGGPQPQSMKSWFQSATGRRFPVDLTLRCMLHGGRRFVLVKAKPGADSAGRDRPASVADAPSRSPQAAGPTVQLIIDPESCRIVDANAAAVALYGHPEDRLRGLHLAEMTVGGHGDVQGELAAAANCKEHTIHCTQRIAGGALRELDMQCTAFRYDGRALVHAIVQDTDDDQALEHRLRSAEARIATSLESISDGFALWDAQDRLVLWNRKFDELAPGTIELNRGLAFAQLTTAVLDCTTCLAHEIDREDWIRRLAKIHEVGGTMHAQRPSGQWLLFSEHPIAGGGVVSLRTDITELKTRENELIEANCRIERQASDLTRLANDLESEIIAATRARQQAEMANKAKSTFLATMSHELRTPLNAILGFSEMLVTEDLAPRSVEQVTEYAGYIHESGRLLLDIINDILDIAKIETGKFPMAPEQLDVEEIVQNCLRLVTTTSEEKRLNMNLEMPGKPTVLYADRRAFKQILFNLLSNAVKFTQPKGSITVRIRPHYPEWVKLVIVDTGVGIPKDRIESVQRPFERIDNCYSAMTSGAGLGLALVKGLVNLHGGRLLIDSEENRGTTVTVYLPSRPQAAGEMDMVAGLAT